MAGKKQTDKYALLSVFNKTGIVELARALSVAGYRIISTGGTAKALSEHGIDVVPIQEITGNPESFDGRMKTISFQIESGILFDRSNPLHVQQAKELKIKSIDVVVCNLYPFEQTISKKNVLQNYAVEQIDVGGPAMIRAAAKNFKHVLVVVDPNDYKKVSTAITTNILVHLQKELAAKAFALLSFYDSQIATYLSEEQFPQFLTLPGRKLLNLRYGENPHQKGAVYVHPNTNSAFMNLKKLWGRELSLTNVSDINAGIESVRMFTKPAAVVIKHNNPCGIAIGNTPKQSLERAIEADPESAFGGVIVLNKPMDEQTAKVISSFKDEGRGNIDIVAVPSISTSAFTRLSTLRKSMGIYTFGKLPKKRTHATNLKWIDGGFIAQDMDDVKEQQFKNWKVVTKKKPSAKQIEQMKLAWKFITRIRSNAIIVVDKSLPMTRGIGTGQTSRIRSTKIALEQAGKFTKGGILASDSFFPFDDSVQMAAKAGITAIVQQGGSINDNVSIDAANKAGIIMVFTGQRSFWH